jgi:hypothetical protein
MDHPGWKQIIQTKQSQILEDFRKLFPEMGIEGIALILGGGKIENRSEKLEDRNEKIEERREGIGGREQGEESEGRKTESPEEREMRGVESIEDEEFREKLISLGQSIAEREKKS